MSLPASVVSVIIPVYNDADGLRRCLVALQQQTYPADRFEVIVVDNASDTPLSPVVDAFPRAQCLRETKQGSYAARNRGIAEARGDVLAFTDADCTPAPAWIGEGVQTLHREQADAAAGAVAFTFQGKEPNPWEYYDAQVYLQQEKNVRTLGAASTANLFVTREAIEHFGCFNEDLQSGGDFEFTRRISQGDGTLVYAPAAVVKHPARASFAEILKRDRRVQEGSIILRREAGERIAFPSSVHAYVPTKSIPNPGARPLSMKEKGAAYLIFNARRFMRTYFHIKHALLQRMGYSSLK